MKMFFARTHLALLLFLLFGLLVIFHVFNSSFTVLSWASVKKSGLWKSGQSPGQTWDERQKARQIRLAKVCQQNKGRTRSIVDPDRFLYEPRSNVLWCDVAKAGSTTYVRSIFFKIAKEAGLDIYVGRGGKKEIDRKKVQDHFKVYTRKNMERILKKNPFIFAVSRHPFQRLVSAFLDFKERPTTRMAKGTFTNFLTSSVLKNNPSCTGGGCVGITNHHWRPIDVSCSFCAINFTVLSSMETFAEDFALISSKYGIPSHPEAKRVRGGSKIEELTAKYFADVPTHVKEKLKRLYRLDLAMFGYEANI